MQKHIVALVAIVLIGAGALLAAGQVFASAGSGQSADNRNDDFVVICHYDRNQQGPNAGPHTITINRNALEHHLENHVKKEGFVGDDSIGPCPGDPVPTAGTTRTSQTPTSSTPGPGD